MAIIHLPNGIGDTLGDILVTTSPLEINGNVWYVHYGTGTDAVSPAGQNRQAPLKTLAQANTNASSGDIIVLMDGHEETITSVITVSNNVTIVGAGSSGGYPTVKLTNNQSDGAMIALSGTGLQQLRNIWFEEQYQACSVEQVVVSSTGVAVIANCYFEAGQYDDDFKLVLRDAAAVIIKNTTFVSTATSIATQPLGAIGTYTPELDVYNIIMDGVVVDGGTYGWSNYHAIDLVDASPVNLAAENISLLRGSDVKLHSTMVGYFNASTKTGGCRIDWDGVT